MLFEQIKAGDRVEITSKNNKDAQKVYISQVEDVVDDMRLLLHVPVSYSRVVMLDRSQVYSFLYFTEKGMIRFDTSILDYEKRDGLELMHVNLISAGERMQRREFFRFTCLLPLQFVDIDDNNEDVTVEMQKGIIKDLGGGGIRFVSNYSMEEKSTVRCIIPLDTSYMITVGKVLHKQYFPKSNFKYQYRVEFAGILPEEREKIVQYIFGEQRKVMKKKDWK